MPTFFSRKTKREEWTITAQLHCFHSLEPNVVSKQ